MTPVEFLRETTETSSGLRLFAPAIGDAMRAILPPNIRYAVILKQTVQGEGIEAHCHETISTMRADQPTSRRELMFALRAVLKDLEAGTDITTDVGDIPRR